MLKFASVFGFPHTVRGLVTRMRRDGNGGLFGGSGWTYKCCVYSLAPLSGCKRDEGETRRYEVGVREFYPGMYSERIGFLGRMETRGCNFRHKERGVYAIVVHFLFRSEHQERDLVSLLLFFGAHVVFSFLFWIG